jgi:hypothetical protein
MMDFEFVSDFDLRISDLAPTDRLTPGGSPRRRGPPVG